MPIACYEQTTGNVLPTHKTYQLRKGHYVMDTFILAQPQSIDNRIFDEWTRQAETAIDALFVWKAWIRAWQSHPLRGQLPAGLFEDVVKDMDRSGLMPWLRSGPELDELRKAVCGEAL